MTRPSLLINTTPLLSQLTGVGQYTFEIAKRLESLDTKFDINYFPVDPKFEASGQIVSDDSSQPTLLKRKVLTSVKSFLSNYPQVRGLVKKALTASQNFSKKKCDVYFEPNHIASAPYDYKKLITTVHDFSCEKYPQWHPHARIEYFSKYFRKNLEQSDLIITVSEFIRNEAIFEFGVPAEKVITVHNGVDNTFFCELDQHAINSALRPFELQENYILYTGTLEPRKNLKTLIKAYSTLPDRIQKIFPLVIVGAKGWKNSDILSYVNKNNIKILGYVTRNQLVALYNAATCFAYIPWYEGFGLPPIEAMACGCPCLVSNIGSISEVCGDSAIYVQPDDIDSIRENLINIIENEELQQKMRLAGLMHSKKFSWEECAKKHAEIFSSVLDR